MSLFQGMNISGSALTVNRLRMDIISSNIANADTTRGQYVNGAWVPYRRKMVSVAPMTEKTSFQEILHNEMDHTNQAGVKVTGIYEDPSPDRLIYDPSHPDADANGYVRLPNVDILREMVDLMNASRSYDANVTALNATKAMYMKALEIGK
ncbi:MAG: flagellar basal body rod protein FlgC [Thermicanus sp.]|nr:flagellar basal body rod protein FlgC [Thermicanus sp.]